MYLSCWFKNVWIFMEFIFAVLDRVQLFLNEERTPDAWIPAALSANKDVITAWFITGWRENIPGGQWNKERTDCFVFTSLDLLCAPSSHAFHHASGCFHASHWFRSLLHCIAHSERTLASSEGEKMPVLLGDWWPCIGFGIKALHDVQNETYANSHSSLPQVCCLHQPEMKLCSAVNGCRQNESLIKTSQ